MKLIRESKLFCVVTLLTLVNPFCALESKPEQQMTQEEQRQLDLALIDAAARSESKVARLIKSGANVNAFRDRSGMTALMVAAYCGDYNIVQALLLVPGININAADKHGITALMWAVGRNSSMVPLLLADEHWLLPLLRGPGHSKVIKALLSEPDIRVNNADERGRTALLWATCDGQLVMIQPLIDAGADVNAQDEQGNTALLLAVERGRIKIVRILIDAGCDINHVNKSGDTASLLADKNGRLNVVKTLFNAGAGV